MRRRLSLTPTWPLAILCALTSAASAVAAPPGAAVVSAAESKDLSAFDPDHVAADDAGLEFVPKDEARFDAETLRMLELGSVIDVPSAGGPLRMELADRSISGTGTLVLTFLGGPEHGSPMGSEARLALRDEFVAGFIRARDGFETMVVPIDAGRQSLTFQPGGAFTCGVGLGNVDPGEGAQPVEGGLAGGCGDPASLQDLLVVYTPTASASVGGTVAIELLIEASIADANASLRASSLDNRIRLVKVVQFAFPESGDIFTDLPRLRNPADGFGDFVHTLRNQFGADLVQLVAVTGGACGLAYLFEDNDGAGFSVVASTCLGNYTPAHEIGHNFGACHAIGEGGGCENGGLQPWSNGWRFTGNSGTLWRTIMSVGPGERIGHYSDPQILFDGGPTGAPGTTSSAARNADTIAETAQAIADFRCAVGPILDCNGNGVPDDIDLIDGTAADCNGNGVPDSCDIASGTSLDLNGNSVPDECGNLPAKFQPVDPSFDPRVLDSFGFASAVGRVNLPTDPSPFYVIGSFGDDQGGQNAGAAYVFTYSGANLVQSAKLIANDAATSANMNMGRSVAAFKRAAATTPPTTARTFAVAGAYRAPNGATQEQGAVYVFTNETSSWAQRSRITPADGTANNWFGFATTFSRIGLDVDDQLVAGAPQGADGRGAVYVYRYRNDHTVTLARKLVVPFSSAGADFGWSVAIDNYTAIIGGPPPVVIERAILVAGAPGYGNDVGRVRAYERALAANVNWPSNGPNILAPNPTDGDRFGESVAIADNWLAVGAPGRNGERGEVFVYERVAVNTWIFRESFTLPDAAAGDRFGTSVGLHIASDGAVWLAAGAPRKDQTGPGGLKPDVGRLFVRRKPASSNTWIAVAPNLPTDLAAGDQFGTSCVVYQRGATLEILTGSPFDDDTGINSGSTYIVRPSSTP
jgi:hypothetical protein